MQKRLREQVAELVQNFATRVSDQADRFKKITDFLKQSVPEMQGAEGKLQASNPEAGVDAGAARAASSSRRPKKSTSWRSAPIARPVAGAVAATNKMAEELADLFELEVDRMANQYETSQRATQQQADQKIDELAEKLKELARRQEQEAERQRRRAAAGQGSGGGDSQRALAAQAEEAARQLEKLARDGEPPRARAIRAQAAAGRRCHAKGRGERRSDRGRAGGWCDRPVARGTASARAIPVGARARRDIQDAQRQAEALAREQADIQKDVSNLDAGGSGRDDKVQQLSERKGALAGKVDQLEKQLDQTASSMFKDERDASRKLTDAANGIRDKRIRDKIRYSDQMLRGGGQTGEVAAFERDIQGNLDDLRNKIGEAAAAMGHTKADASTQALDKARQLAQGMDSLGERMRGQRGQQDQNGQQGQNGQRPIRTVTGCRPVNRDRTGNKANRASQDSKGKRPARTKWSAGPERATGPERPAG